MTSSRLEGDHSVFLYGFGASVAHFGSLAASSSPVVPPVVLGDLNLDGRINVQDATISLRLAVSLITPDEQLTAAGDVNNDDRLNVQDTTLILRFAVGLIDKFPGQ